MDSIVSSWHSKGLHTPQEIREGDTISSGRPSASGSAAGKIPAPGQNELQRIERLMDQMKKN